MAQPAEAEATSTALEGLVKLLEHRVRLAVCVLLTRHDALSFTRLRDLLDETDGSLGAHLRRLEEEGFIQVKKEFVDRKPLTWYSLSPQGRKCLERHVEALELLVGSANLD